MSRTVISAATVITMEKDLGEIPAADILIDGEKISAIERAGKISAEVKDAEVIDGRNFIVIPGFINAHLHTWQTSLRSIASNWTLTEYFKKMHSGLAKVFGPEDMYIAN